MSSAEKFTQSVKRETETKWTSKFRWVVSVKSEENSSNVDIFHDIDGIEKAYLFHLKCILSRHNHYLFPS